MKSILYLVLLISLNQQPAFRLATDEFPCWQCINNRDNGWQDNDVTRMDYMNHKHTVYTCDCEKGRKSRGELK